MADQLALRLRAEAHLPRQLTRDAVAEVAREIARSVACEREQELLLDQQNPTKQQQCDPDTNSKCADLHSVGEIDVEAERHRRFQAEHMQAMSEAECDQLRAENENLRRQLAELQAALATLLQTTTETNAESDTQTDVTPEAERQPSQTDAASPAEQTRSLLAPGLSLYPWQRDALGAWQSAGHRGVIEAVTGAGKSRVAHWAAAEALDRGMRVLVIVPTIELMNQWHQGLEAAIPSVAIGRLGNAHCDTLRSRRIVVATVHSARRRRLAPNGTTILLIADECHRYGAPSFAKALDPEFEQRLGLTATYDRGDTGNERYLEPYFGGIVKALWYDEALAQEAISPFRIALVAVRFNDEDQATYSFHDENAKQARGELIDIHGVAPEPFGEFMRQVTELSDGGAGDATKAARRYLGAFSKRRQLLAETECKIPILEALAPAVSESGGTLVFTQTKDSARRSAELFRAAGCSAEALYSDLDEIERGGRMDRFKDGRSRLISAPRLLDEGIDVPKADLGIIVAASRSKRQMIQRLGRVIRRKPEGAFGRLVVLYVGGTVEDPHAAGGESDSFLRRCCDSAQEVAEFPGTSTTALQEFLSVRKPADLAA